MEPGVGWDQRPRHQRRGVVGTGTIGVVETDLELEVSWRERGRAQTWEGGKRQRPEKGKKLGQRRSLGPILRGRLELQECPGWVAGTLLFVGCWQGDAQHRVAAGNFPGVPSRSASLSSLPNPSRGLSGSAGCGPSQSLGQVVSGLFWCAV